MRDSIMVHHSLTKDGETVSWSAIRKFHVETNGWTDIGYHAGIELVGGSYEVLIGRPEHRPAAACPQSNMNRRALHFCFVGNYDLVRPPAEMLKVAAERILKDWMDRYGITPDRIVTHNQYNPAKSCPGTQFDIEELREIL